MPKKSIREIIRELEAERKHADVVSLCSQALERQPSREDRIFLCRKQAQNLAAMNPEAWGSHIVSALKVALDDADGDPASQAQLLTALSAAQAPLGLPDQVQAILQRWQMLADQWPLPEVVRYEGDIRYNLGRCFEVAHNLYAAEAPYQRALECFREAKDGVKVGRALHNLAHVYVQMGRPVEARAALNESEQLVPDELWGAKVACLKGKVAFAEGDSETAIRCFSDALAHASLDESTRVDVFFAWAQLERKRGNLSRAASLARDALIITYKLPYREARRPLELFLSELDGGEGL